MRSLSSIIWNVVKPFLILSHGLESGPEATKVTALAKVAESLGFRSVRPDYRDLDATRDVRRIDAASVTRGVQITIVRTHAAKAERFGNFGQRRDLRRFGAAF